MSMVISVCVMAIAHRPRFLQEVSHYLSSRAEDARVECELPPRLPPAASSTARWVSGCIRTRTAAGGAF